MPDDNPISEERCPFPSVLKDLVGLSTADECILGIIHEIPWALLQYGIAESVFPFPPKMMKGLTEGTVMTHAGLVARFGDRNSRSWGDGNPYLLVLRDYWRINILFLQHHGKSSSNAEDIRSRMRELETKGVEQASMVLLAGRAWLSELNKARHSEEIVIVRERLKLVHEFCDETLQHLSALKTVGQHDIDFLTDPVVQFARYLCAPNLSEWPLQSSVDRFEEEVKKALAGVKATFEEEEERLKGSQARGGGLAPLAHAAYAEIVSQIKQAHKDYGSLRDATDLFHKWGIELTPDAHKEWQNRQKEKGHTG
jgi:hypothetical protein